MKTPEILRGVERANRLIEWMSKHIGAMAPGTYAECYRDLNEHGIFIGRLRAEGLLPSETKEG